jgi:hypothetical protein
VISGIHVYYEGHKLLIEGFSQFFAQLRKSAHGRRCHFRLIPAGSGSAACDRFGIAIRANKDVWNILLTGSEGPDTGGLSESLCRKYDWDGNHQDSIFRMVEMMESWLHADKDTLEEFYGRGFRRNALKANPKVEEISKADLENGLKAATKDTGKGEYFDHKTSHGPKLLCAISAEKVQAAAPNCKKLFATVLAKLDESGSR